MSTPCNVLVFPAGTEIAFEIQDALKYSKFVRLFGATGSSCHADFVFASCYEGLPYADDPAIVDALNKIVDENHIDYIYPAHDSALLTLSEYRDKLHCPVIVPDRQTVEICRDKDKTYKFLQGASYLPGVYENPDEIPCYPVFIKPAVGQGSEGARLIADRPHLEEALREGRKYAICEYLPGAEFTVDCFTDRHGTLRFIGPRSRDRIRAGIAVRSHTLPSDPELQKIAEDINSRLNFNGAWFFQVKKNAAGEYRLMEIAPRIAGTMGLTRNLGINMPLLTLYNFWGYDVGLLINDTDLLLDRAFISRFRSGLQYDTVYVDYDDTLIINGKVNSLLIMYLYQAKDRGKKLILLSKHASSLDEDLDRYHICPGLFDKIIHLSKSEAKADHMEGNSIFIDDSFAERKAVRERLGIPVFDLDMVESLLDWRF